MTFLVEIMGVRWSCHGGGGAVMEMEEVSCRRYRDGGGIMEVADVL